MYQKLLEFYNAAFQALTKKGVKFVIGLVLQNGRLPEIVQDFLRHADLLRKLVQKATWEIVEDIRTMLFDHESVCQTSKNSPPPPPSYGFVFVGFCVC